MNEETNEIMDNEVQPQVADILAKHGLQELPKTLRDAELGERGLYLFPDFSVQKLRGWRVAEEDLLTSRKKNKNGEAVNDVLKAISDGENALDWLMGARTFALIQAKRLSHGDEFDFRCQCEHCSETVNWTEDLGSLPVQYLNEPDKLKFDFTFPISGHKIVYRLLNGYDERKLTKALQDNDESKQSTLMLFRTESIEGVKMKSLKWFKELEAADAKAFRDEVETRDCGVDTTVKVTCDKCFREFETELPIGLDFFLARKVRPTR